MTGSPKSMKANDEGKNITNINKKPNKYFNCEQKKKYDKVITKSEKVWKKHIIF